MSALKISTVFLFCLVCSVYSKSVSHKTKNTEWHQRQVADVSALKASLAESNGELVSKRENVKRYYYLENEFWMCVGEFNNCLADASGLGSLVTCHYKYLECIDKTGLDDEKSRLLHKAMND